MKRTIFFFLAVVFLTGAVQVEAQQDFKYRRSSLSMVLIESDDFPNKDAVLRSWSNYPFPEKYNKHHIDLKSINIEAIVLSDQDYLQAGYLTDTLRGKVQIAKAKGMMKELRMIGGDESTAVVLPSEKEAFQMKIDKVLREQQVARQLVASWFGRTPDGKFNMNLIQERGFYNATEMEASIAKGQARGVASLGDAGEELIRNTFITFTRLDFVENEPAAALARDAAKLKIQDEMQGKPQLLIEKAKQSQDKIYEKTKEGYSLWSKTWLYRLSWNDSIAAVFYTDLWNNPAAWETTNLFSLEFVGVQYNQSLVTFKVGETRSQDQIIDLALVRNIDNAFVELQRDNEVFMPKVPVISANPLTAQVGMKEGLVGGEKFDVLEMTMDPNTGLTQYKKVGTATADKKLVWDNRYNAGDKPEVEQTDATGQPIKSTYFNGPKNVQPGMLLKQVK